MVDNCHRKKLSEGVHAWNRWRQEHPEIFPDLRKANLRGELLNQIDFRRTNLDAADLQGANLCSAFLDHASFYRTNLCNAKLRNANLHKTLFKETLLQHANFYKASLQDTGFLNVDLRGAINLETIIHNGSSIIGIDTIQQSKGNIPDIFLSGAGISEPLIACIRSAGLAPFDYYTCFISYSSRDGYFVKHLYQDLRKEGVLCWYAPESLKTGDKFPAEITEAVQSREKVLVVISKDSLKSNWVRHEVQLARQKEGKEKKNVLLPINLDSTVSRTDVDWAVSIRQHRHIRSFENWQQPSPYQKMLNDLLNDLRKQ